MKPHIAIILIILAFILGLRCNSLFLKPEFTISEQFGKCKVDAFKLFKDQNTGALEGDYIEACMKSFGYGSNYTTKDAECNKIAQTIAKAGADPRGALTEEICYLDKK